MIPTGCYVTASSNEARCADFLLLERGRNIYKINYRKIGKMGRRRKFFKFQGQIPLS